MSDNIPYEIQLEIIKKVSDVKSLIRFTSVSKPWKSFIESSEFISGYGTRDSQLQSFLLRYTDNLHPYEVKYVSFVDGENNVLTQQDFAPNVSDLVKHLECSTLIGSSCGLWCLHGYKKFPTQMVVIWNSSIRKCVGIVLPRFLNSSPGYDPPIGFGVCPSTYDPTIVGISRCFLGKYKQIGIFTLSSKTWKMIPTSNVLRESIILQFSAHLAIDRFIYWLAYDEIVINDVWFNSKNLMLSFDLITHEFKEVNLPVSIANEVKLAISISKLNESLVVSAFSNVVNNGLVYSIWMMGEEAGVMTSFTKLFNIKTPHDLPITKVLGFTMNGEPIMETKRVNEEFAKVKVYKPCTEHTNDLGITGKHYSFFIFSRIQTLLLVDHLDCSIIFNGY